MKMEGLEVIYIGPFSFPDGGAAARRILGNVKSLKDVGYEVKIVSGQMIETSKTPLIFEGIEVFSVSERTAENLPRLLKHFVYLTMGKKTIAWLNALSKMPYAIVLYSGYSPYLIQLIPWAKRNGVRLIFDAVEWYSPTSLIQWILPYQLNIELAMRFLIPKVSSIITISSYLHRYYGIRNCYSLKIPPTLDVLNTIARIKESEVMLPLKLVYAGSPGKKDLLNNIMEAVLCLHEAGYKLRLFVAGVTFASIEDYLAIKSRPLCEIRACIDFKGVLSHEESIDLVRNADFSVLLRGNARSSHAGFPTKLVESMAVGTPVIANYTSDLIHYLHDYQTGFVSMGSGSQDLEFSLMKALRITSKQYTSMRNNCRTIAEESFDYRVYSTALSSFLLSSEI